jgi:cyanate permease
LLDHGASAGLMAAVLIGLGLGAEIDLIAFMQSRYFGRRAFGEIYGYFFAIFMFASGFGPFLMGQAFRVSGSYEPFLLVSMAGLAVACLLMVMLSRRPERVASVDMA